LSLTDLPGIRAMTPTAEVKARTSAILERAPRPQTDTSPSSPKDSTAQRFHFRSFTPQDLTYIRAWLPDAIGGTPAASITIATDAVTGKIAGVGALRVFVDRVGRFLLFVDPTQRRRGCGTALLVRVRQTAQAARASRLLTGRSAEATIGDEATKIALAFLRANGMSVGQEVVRYRADLKSALAVLKPLYQRFEQQPAGPGRPRIVTANQVDPRALANFVVRDVGGIPQEIAARLTGQGPSFCLATSHVALVENAIVGAVLTQRHGTAVLIETRAVEVTRRGSGVNLALMYHGIAVAATLGIETIEFEHDISERDTAKLARRFNALTIGRRQCCGCSLLVAATKSRLESGWQAAALQEPLVDGLSLKLLQERLFFNSANDVIQMLNERGVDGMSIVNHARGVTLQVKMVRHGPETFYRTSGLKTCLLLAVVPRSASVFAFETLATGLGLDRVTVCAHQFPQEKINPQSVARLAIPGTICHSHVDARLGNLAAINPFLERMVVHVRDPRQAMLSAVHHLNDLRSRKGASHVAGFGIPLPNDYFDLPLTEQIDFMIEHGLPEFVRWIEGWMEAAANPLFKPRLLFTRFEDLHADPAVFFKSILDFYGVAWRSADFKLPAATSGSRHFRKGMKDEWRTVLTAAQCEAACARVPTLILDRFDWPAR
jgi:GNAT superfamily N-acetyltransferase